MINRPSRYAPFEISLADIVFARSRVDIGFGPKSSCACDGVGDNCGCGKDVGINLVIIAVEPGCGEGQIIAELRFKPGIEHASFKISIIHPALAKEAIAKAT